MSSATNKFLTVAEIIDILDEDDEFFMEPPNVNILTDEDSDEEGEVGGNVNTLSRNQLLAPAEIRRRNEDSDEEGEVGGNINTLSRNQLLAPAEIRRPNEELPTNVNQQDSKRRKVDVKKDNEIRWKLGGKTSKITEFQVSDNNFEESMTAVQYFELFFDEALIDIIIAESSRYCLSKNWPDVNLSAKELKIFFGILIVSGYNPLSSKAFYWSTGDDLRNHAVYNSMRRNRFDTIMKSLIFQSNDNLDKSDKFCKLRPLISHLQKAFMKHFQPTESISHDEAMVQYFGKHGCKQAIRNKPIRFGYKIWCQNSPSGYLIAFEPYQGKTYQGNEEMESQFGKCASTLLQLIDQYPLSKSMLPYHFYCDNLFTTFPLLKEMKNRGFNCTGTIRNNRLGNNCCLEDVNAFKKKERGVIQTAMVNYQKEDFYVTRWKDNAVVTVASTVFAADPEGKAKRWSKSDLKYVDLSIPYSIQNYNKNMGGTDRMDQNVNADRISIRSKKWWWSLFTWMLDVSIQNAWLLSRQHDPKLKQKSFRREVAMAYLMSSNNLPKPGGRKPNSQPGADSKRYDQYMHFVQRTKNNKQRRCAGDKCKSTVRTECQKCDIGLCIDCFLPYHQK